MSKNEKKLIIISLILVIALGAVISFLIYMKGNEYSKIAWNALSKEQRKNVIGGGSLSHVETIKPKNSYIVPNDPISKMQNRYEAQDELCIYFKDWVPDFITRIKIALMDGRIIQKKNKYSGPLIQIKGISQKRLAKLIAKLNKNDTIVAAVNYDSLPFKGYDLTEIDLVDIKNREAKVVSFYYFKGIKLYHYIVYVVKDTLKTYVIDTQAFGQYIY